MTATSLQRRLAHSHLRAAERALREAEKVAPGCTQGLVPAIRERIAQMAEDLAAEAAARHPGVHVSVRHSS